MKNITLLLILSVFLTSLSCTESSSGRIVPEKNYLKRREAVAKQAGDKLIVVNPKTKRGADNMNIYYLTGQYEKGQTLVFEAKRPKEYRIFTEDQKAELDQMIEGRELFNPDSLLVFMRVIKEPHEITAIREACRITAEGIKYMYNYDKHDMSEKQIRELMRQEFIRLGAQEMSFGQVASGNSATSPHAPTTDKIPLDNEMFVVDIGAFVEGYTSDITVSFTKSGDFTPEQQTLYDIIYTSLEKGIAAMVKGNTITEVENIAKDYIIEQLYNKGLVTDINSKWQRSFWIQHGFSHHIGLEVHDVWYDYLALVPEKERILMPGMILTLEPGLYFTDGALDKKPRKLNNQVDDEQFYNWAKSIEAIYDKYSGIGIRLEENILIKEDGTNENLTYMTIRR